MKTFSKAILIAAALGVVLVLGAVISVQFYLQSGAAQARLQEELSHALRLPVTLARVHLDILGELRAEGLVVPGEGSNFLQAAALHARWRPQALLHRQLVLHSVTLEQPVLTWPQNAEGRWVMPTMEKQPMPAEQKPKSLHERESGAGAAWTVVIEDLHVRHGSAALLDGKAHPVATVEEIEADCPVVTNERVAGTVTASRIAWTDAVSAEQVRTAFSSAAGVLDLTDLSALIGGGPLHGAFKLRSNEPKSPFLLTAQFSKVDLSRLSTEGHWSIGQTMGQLEGAVELTGLNGALDRGTTNLLLRNGRFRDMSYLDIIGQALQLEQLSDLRIEEARAAARLTDDRVFLDTLTLRAADLEITAKDGVARYSGKMQIPARLSVTEALFQQLPLIARDNFVPGEHGVRSIDFNITGQTTKPKTDLLDKAVGQKLQSQFNDLVNGLFGGHKKGDEKKPDRARRESTPAPAATAPPP